MALIYAISDIHGERQALQEALEKIDLTNPQNKLVLLGDYIDNGPDSCQVLCDIYELSQKYGKQVVALRGNHDQLFIEFIMKGEMTFLYCDTSLATTETFISKEQRAKVMELAKTTELEGVGAYIQMAIRRNHRYLISWLAELAYYYETENQIFVHAGIDEESNDLWREATPEDMFIAKYPATIGGFDKDIIAGHIYTSEVSGDEDFYGVYWDNQNHYYIDGNVNISKKLPILVYDTESEKYSEL